MKPKGKLKIPTVRVPSDACAVNVGQVVEDGEITVPGTLHYVHVGEWVEMMPVLAVKEVVQLSRLQRGSDDNGGLGENLTQLCHELSKRVLSWNWTGMMGESLPQPYNRPEILEDLTADELMWLIGASSGQEESVDRKKDSEASVNTSLAMAPSPSSPS